MLTTARTVAARYTYHLLVCLLLGAAAAVGYDMAHTSPLHEAREHAAATVTVERVGHKMHMVPLPPLGADAVSDCADGLPVWIDASTGRLYGDQDGNGRLDGADCNWT